MWKCNEVSEGPLTTSSFDTCIILECNMLDFLNKGPANCCTNVCHEFSNTNMEIIWYLALW